jgi:hypothetical protein
MLNINDFLELISKKYAHVVDDIHNLSNKESVFRDRIATMLSDEGFHVKTEWRYPSSSNRCDVVIINSSNQEKIDHWIEIKAFWKPENTMWLRPFKFFRESHFRHDPEKLAGVSKEAHAWFVAIAFSDNASLPELSLAKNPRTNDGLLSISQAWKAISLWANSQPSILTLGYGNKYCNIGVWDIKQYIPDAVRESNGYYILT